MDSSANTGQRSRTVTAIRRLNWLAVTAGLFAVVVLHSALFFVLYRARVVSDWQVARFDSVVFGLPFLIAYSGFAYFLSRSSLLSAFSAARRALVIHPLSLLVSFISFWCSLLLPFNLYGT
jgi:hypothetical protein